ncbi:MAG: GMP synthase [Bacteroidota bacterium]
MSNKLQLAILDLYNGIPNQGMRCIKDIVEAFSDEVEYQIFDVRGAREIPSLDQFDIFISSGGPGDPLEGDGVWEVAYNNWLDAVWAYNQTEVRKKHVFFICHSFQMAIHHYGLAKVGPRKSISFGTFPVHPVDGGVDDPIFAELDQPFYVADFRRYQVTQPNDEAIAAMGAEIIALEKIRPHVPLERAVMGIRWSPEIVGTQFHPEADAEGMLSHFSRPDIKAEVITEHGRDKWLQMMADLSDENKIGKTHDVVIPTFIRNAIDTLRKQEDSQPSVYDFKTSK